MSGELITVRGGAVLAPHIAAKQIMRVVLISGIQIGWEVLG
jgi:hypothetical protein